MSLLDQLYDDYKWELFLESKLNNRYLSDDLKKQYQDFIINRHYQSIVQQMFDMQLSIPQLKLINKKHQQKKEKYLFFLLNLIWY